VKLYTLRRFPGSHAVDSCAAFTAKFPEGYMAYNPFEKEEETEGSMDLEMIRDDLVAELKAINEYEAQVEMLDNEDAADAIEQILEDKKVHVARLIKLMKTLDPVQGEKLDNELR
jgi:rubrerythrin